MNVDSEILNILLKNDKIRSAIVAFGEEGMKNEFYLDMHTYKIWLASDGYWKTKVKESDGSLRLLKKKNKPDLEDAIVDFYKKHSEKETFKHRFDIWVERQKNCGRSGNTIQKYESDYKRFFSGYPIEDLDIRDINEETLSQHILQVIQDKQIRWRAFKDIVGYMNGVFEKAKKDRLIEENPCEYLDLPVFKKYCYVPPVKTTTERTLTENDIHTLKDRIRHPRAKNCNRISGFAIELALCTGMRVGELAALMWQDIIFEEDIIVIRHMDRYDRKTKTSSITTTKTGRERLYPLVPEIKRLLFEIRDYEIDRGWFGEYVFQDSEGRITKAKISDAVRNYTMSEEFTGIKSIHDIRRTVNSRMKLNGVSTTTASALLGHSERVNEQNYTYDLSELETKKAIVEQICQP